MRKLLVLLVVTRAAAAEPLGEYGEAVYLRTPEHVKAAPCEVALRFDGAIVDGWLRERLTNTGDSPLGAVEEVALPRDALVVGAKLDGDAAVAVAVPYSSEPATDAVGADPLLVTSIEGGVHPRVRMVVAPFTRSVTVQLHFTALAQVHGGALRLALPDWTCQRSVTVKPLAGAALVREHDTPQEVVAELAYAKPLVWTQTQPLGGGYTARAVTKLAPIEKMPEVRRVIFLLDGSRSMELVGEPAVAKVLHAVAGAVPKDADVQGVIFDRKPGAVITGVPAIAAAYHAHVPANGSDPLAALTFVHNLIADAKGTTMIVAITDGAFGDITGTAFTHAIRGGAGKVELHTIALDRGYLTAPSSEPLRMATDDVGGSFAEVNVDDLDDTLTNIDTWLRPTVEVGGAMLYAGTATTDVDIVKGSVAGSPASIAEHALILAELADRYDDKTRADWLRRHPALGNDLAFTVLATTGTVARARHDTVAGGGPFARTVATPDPPFEAQTSVAQLRVIGPSALDHALIERLLQLQLEPAAYACFNKALAKNPKLGGRVGFHLEIARGEVTQATIDGLGDRDFDACLVDAAYRIVPPMPDPTYNTDDRSLVTYPLTFSLHADQPLIVAGDADSTTPADIDGIVGGVARPPRHIDAGDTTQPLGGLHSTLQPRP